MTSPLSDLRLFRLRRHIDEEIARIGASIEHLREAFPSSTEGQIEYMTGQIYALEKIKVFYLLTESESSAAEALRREMFESK